MGKYAIGIVFLLLAGIGFAVTVNPCSDGTPYYECSTQTPGKFCKGTASSPTLEDYATKCGCDFAGYTVDPENPDRCKALAAGCANDNPPCEEDENCVDNVCVKKEGCQYENPACSPEEECKNNECVKKSGCEFNNPPCNAGYMCQKNECVALDAGGGDAGQQPAGQIQDLAQDQPESHTANLMDGPDLLAHEPKEGFVCCASSLAILLVGMFVVGRRK